MMENFNFADIEAKIGYEFKNKSLLLQAFTRSSYAAENFCEDNEVLEFIGDSVLGAVVSKQLTMRFKFPVISEKQHEINRKAFEKAGLKYVARKGYECALEEGELTQLKIELVQSASLAAATERMGLQNCLRMGRGDVVQNVQEQQSVKEDLFEAILGAVAVDSGWDFSVLEAVASKMLEIDRLLEDGIPGAVDYEKELEKWFLRQGEKPKYEDNVYRCAGLEYAFRLCLGGGMLNHCVYGYGKTERGARRMAAKEALAFIRKIENGAKNVREVIGEPDRERSVNQLQELWQKKLIPEPQYSFEKRGKNEKGNEQWACSCRVEGVYERGVAYICDTKIEGKKQAAFEVLLWLLGIDAGEIFEKHGVLVEKKTWEES